MRNFIDLTGKNFGYLFVLQISEKRTKNSEIMWDCKCKCGSIKTIKGSNLRRGTTKSCGCLAKELNTKRNLKFLSGKCFNFWEVLNISTEKTKSKEIKWVCKCKCGVIKTIKSGALISGKSKSCGCFKAEKAKLTHTKHGQSHTKQYNASKQSVLRAKKLQRTPSWANLKDITNFYENCPKGYHVDHIIPLQGKLVSGFHVLENLQYLTREENRKKSNKFISVNINTSKNLFNWLGKG